MRYLSCVAWLALGCSGGNVSPAVEAPLGIRAQSTDGAPLAGVVFEASGRRAVSGGDGTATLTLVGTEGERREIAVTCPEDYEAPASSLVVSIRRSPATARAYHYDVACTPLRHSAVVVTRAVGGADLPILHLGAEIGRTNREGIAHALVSVPAGESLRLTLDTSGRNLLPASPSFDFPAIDHDEILTINQVFEAPPRPKAPRRPVKRAVARPTRL